MKPSFFSGCHPIFFRVAKTPIFSKLRIGCRLNGRIFIQCQDPSVKNTDLIFYPIFIKKKWLKVLFFDKNLTKQQEHFLSHYWIDLKFSSFYQYPDTTNSGLYLVSHVNHVIGDQ